MILNKIYTYPRNLRAQGFPADLADFRRSWVISNKIYTYLRNLRAQGFPANLADFRGSSSFQKVICVYPRPSAGNIFPAFSASSLSPLRETHIGWEAQYKVCKESNLIGFAFFEYSLRSLRETYFRSAGNKFFFLKPIFRITFVNQL